MRLLTEPFQLEFMRRALLATIIVGIVAPVVGTWVVLRRMANLGDAMAHGTLAGVGVAYAAGFNVVLGALGAGVVMAVLLLALSANRRLGSEALIAVLGTAGFAAGVLIISRLDSGVELSHFLFGQLLTVGWGDLAVNAALGAGAIVVIAVLFHELRMATFDHVHAEQSGVHVELVHGVLIALLAVVVVISLRTVGTILSVTMLVTPPATARLFTRTLRAMTGWAVALGVAEGVAGLILSYHLSGGAAPAATIALVAAGVFAVAFVLTLPRRQPHHHRPLA